MAQPRAGCDAILAAETSKEYLQRAVRVRETTGEKFRPDPVLLKEVIKPPTTIMLCLICLSGCFSCVFFLFNSKDRILGPFAFARVFRVIMTG